MSLRTGGSVGTSLGPIINPNNLKIEGFYCADKFSKDTLILLAQDVRDIIVTGLVVNDHDVLTHPDELIRLKKVMDIGFSLLGKPVHTESGKKVGKIADFATDTKTLYVQKLYLTQSLIKSIGSTQLSVDRNQILEITDRKIVIKDLENTNRSRLAAPAPAV